MLESNLVAEKKTRVEVEAENSSLLRKIDDLTHQLDPGFFKQREKVEREWQREYERYKVTVRKREM